jgi:hypothetical protein
VEYRDELSVCLSVWWRSILMADVHVYRKTEVGDRTQTSEELSLEKL